MAKLAPNDARLDATRQSARSWNALDLYRRVHTQDAPAAEMARKGGMI